MSARALAAKRGAEFRSRVQERQLLHNAICVSFPTISTRSPTQTLLTIRPSVRICRDIEPGEEVCYDYATSESETSSHMPFPCACATPGCRGTITGADYLKPEVRAKYAGHFSTMIQGLQAEKDAAAAAQATA